MSNDPIEIEEGEGLKRQVKMVSGRVANTVILRTIIADMCNCCTCSAHVLILFVHNVYNFMTIFDGLL